MSIIKRIGQRDALLILQHFTGKTATEIMLNNYRLPLDTGQAEAVENAITRLQAGEPLQYILGKWEFYGRGFITDARALIPRPETELLVEDALAFIKNWDRPKILDLCTGTGCIAITMAKERPDAVVVGADISPQALALAGENDPAQNVRWIQSDLFAEIHETFDLIISNPPYITQQEMAALDPVVSQYEPHLALYGGVDGLDIYRQLIPQAYAHLHPGGGLFMEIGPSQVYDLMSPVGFENIKMKKDYASLDRIVSGTKEKQKIRSERNV